MSSKMASGQALFWDVIIGPWELSRTLHYLMDDFCTNLKCFLPRSKKGFTILYFGSISIRAQNWSKLFWHWTQRRPVMIVLHDDDAPVNVSRTTYKAGIVISFYSKPAIRQFTLVIWFNVFIDIATTGLWRHYLFTVCWRGHHCLLWKIEVRITVNLLQKYFFKTLIATGLWRHYLFIVCWRHCSLFFIVLQNFLQILAYNLCDLNCDVTVCFYNLWRHSQLPPFLRGDRVS
jgi:hypothetical protein